MESSEILSAYGRKAVIVAIGLCGVALSATAVVHPWLQSIGLVVGLLPALVAWSGFRLPGLVVSFLVCQALAQLLKRAIFLIGPQPQEVYYGVQFIPTLVLLVLLSLALHRLRRERLPWSGRLLAAFLALAMVSTLLSARFLSWWTVLSAIQQQVLPMLMFFVGVLIRPGKFASIGRTMAALAGVSAVYGVIQLIGGPTVIDRAWGAATYAYSIHGSKVFAYLEGASNEFRAYSFYADPLTWGLTLCAGFVGAGVARQLGRLSRFCWWLVTALVLAGLFCTLTRTVWVGLLATAVSFVLLGYRMFRRPWLVFCLTLSFFAVAVMVGGFLYQELFVARRLPLTDNLIVGRYMTTGTIEARISAWDALQEASRTSPLLGQGYGMLLGAIRNFEARPSDKLPTGSHNFLVELVFNTGLPGALLFLLFFLQWLREGFSTLRRIGDPRLHGALRWIIAFTVGSFLTGYLNGSCFMTYEFFLLMGMLAGAAPPVRVSIREPQPIWPPAIGRLSPVLGGRTLRGGAAG